VTHHEIQTLPDGRRRYSNRTHYQPVPADERKYGVNKPDDERAVRFHGQWFLPLSVLPDGDRVLPLTRPDSDAYRHMDRRNGRRSCSCQVCKRPEAAKWQRKWRRDMLRLGDFPDPERLHR
jgi:hypothetical protein